MRPSRALDPIAAVGALAERTRRRLYEYVAARGAAVGRDEAASALHVGRPLAAFHLDRLVESGLLETEYRRMTGRSGPGAGRPAKLYRLAPVSVEVSLPARRYELAAELLAEAVETSSPEMRPDDALAAAARRRGHELAETGEPEEREPEAGGVRSATGRARLLETLRHAGFEPFEDEAAVVRLRNCPFDALVAEHRELTCGMNLALLEGLCDGLGDAPLQPARSVRPGYCCVAFQPDAPPPAEGPSEAA